MQIGVVRTMGSPCQCAESVSVGLQALHHEPFLVDSQEIEIYAQELAQKCHLVIDHTDTYLGRGLYRPMVRLLLENCGARIVGSSAQACFTADNKLAVKARLAEAGVPVPPGIAINSNTWELPDWLRPPLVLKPAFEHMSRGLSLARTEGEAHDAAGRLLDSLHQPILVESYIPGRELAVSLLAGPDGIQVLPVLEWELHGSDTDMLTENLKLTDSADARHAAIRAVLPPDLNSELEEMARRTFLSLNLRDYARFDLRLSPGGSIYFLEANTTPSLEPTEALAVSAAWAGLNYTALVERMLSNARRRYESSALQQDSISRIPLTAGTMELVIVPGVHPPPQSSIDLADLLDFRPGEQVLDLGCGCGFLSIAAAKLGASRVISTDINPQAMQATRENARRNGVGDRIEIRAGSWYESLRDQFGSSTLHERFDAIIATPPQTPGKQPFGPKYGGWDGTKHLRKIVAGAPQFLKPGGRLWIMAISLANPKELFKELHKHFGEVTLVHKNDRPFTFAEYELFEPGLFDYLRSLRASGISDFKETADGRCFFQNLFIRAAGPREI